MEPYSESAKKHIALLITGGFDNTMVLQVRETDTDLAIT